MSAYLYDSAARSLTPRAWVARLWRNGALVRLLVSRELRIRYKRSLLGVWWTLLSPLLEMAALAGDPAEIVARCGEATLHAG